MSGRRLLPPEGLEKLLPQSIEAECGVLGSLIISPDAILEVAPFLRADDFYRDAHQRIFEVIMHLWEYRTPADFITLCDELERRPGTGAGTRRGSAVGTLLDEVGGADYISGLINHVPTSGNVEYYGHIVERTATLRRLIFVAGQIAGRAYDGGLVAAEWRPWQAAHAPSGEQEPAAAAVEFALDQVFKIASRRYVSGPSHIDEVLADFMANLDASMVAYQKKTPTGVPTGLARFDDLTGYLQPGDLVCFAARPGVGKSSIVLTIIRYAITHGYGCLLFSLEMSKLQLARRLISADAPVDQLRLRQGNLLETDEYSEMQAVIESRDRFEGLPFWIDDTAGVTPAQVRTHATRLVTERGVKLIVIDYAQIMRGGLKTENRVQELSYITGELKRLARDLGVPIIIAAQLSRAADGVAPTLATLKESGSFEQDSDLVVGLWSDKDEVTSPDRQPGEPYTVHMRILKQRNGPLDDIDLRFEPRYTRFRERELEGSSGRHPRSNGHAPHRDVAATVPYADDTREEEEMP